MRIGLALAGGGASGGAHVGVIQALQEAGIAADIVGGTSSGAVVAGLLAAGLSTGDMIALLPSITRRQVDVDRMLPVRLLRRQPLQGFLRGDRLQSLLRRMVGDIPLGAARIPLAVVATDLQSGQEVVFASQPCPPPTVRPIDGENASPLWRVVTDVPLAVAIRASIGIPLVFWPVYRDDMILVDGGLVDNCPVAPVRALGADIVVAVDTITPFVRRRTPSPMRARSAFFQMVNISLARHAALAALQADLLLTPPVGPIGALDFSRLASVAEQGYEYTRERLPRVLSALEQRGRGGP